MSGVDPRAASGPLHGTPFFFRWPWEWISFHGNGSADSGVLLVVGVLGLPHWLASVLCSSLGYLLESHHSSQTHSKQESPATHNLMLHDSFHLQLTHA
jgi:hypothetical protein